MGGSSPSTTTQINKTEPDPFTQQWRSQLYGQANQLHQQGPPAYFPGNTVVPFSPWTQAGLNSLTQQANQGAPNLQAANDASGRALSGWNPAMPFATNAASGGLQNGGAAALGPAGQTNIAGQLLPMLQQGNGGNPYAMNSAQTGAQPTDTSALQGFASGQNTNPYLRSLYDSASAPVMDSVNAQFGMAGRTNSARHVGAMTDRLGALASSIYAPAMEAERGRQFSAASQLPGIQQADRGLALQGYGQAGSLYESGAGRALQGAGMYGGALEGDAARGYQGLYDQAQFGENALNRQLAGTELTGSIYDAGNSQALRAQALLPGLYQYGMQPGQAMLDLGGIYEGQQQAQIDDQMARYYHPYNSQVASLNNFANIVNGLPDFSGSTSTSTGQPARNRTMSGMGGALAGAQLGGSFGGPWGAAIGGGVGGLWGLLS